MELIKPFVKYSRTYRFCDDVSSKSEIFSCWYKEANVALQTYVGNTVICDFCYTDNVNTLYCRQCLFPLFYSKLIDKELIIYSLLSVCYWESNEETAIYETAHVSQIIWRERIKITWKMYENIDNKLYKITSNKCIQCEQKCYIQNFKTNKFTYDLFCSKCLFPLFEIVIR